MTSTLATKSTRQRSPVSFEKLFGFDPRRAQFWIQFSEFKRLFFCPSAVLDKEEISLRSWNSTDTEGTFACTTKVGEWTLEFQTDGELIYPSVSIVLRGRLNNPMAKAVLKPMCFDRFEADHVVGHGRKMGGCSLNRLQEGKEEDLKSVFILNITDQKRTLQLSHPMEQEYLSDFDGKIAGMEIQDLTVSSLIDPCVSLSVESVPVALSVSRDGHGQMSSWAEAQVTSREPSPLPTDSGWNTWDYYRWTINEEEVLKNADFIASDPVLSQHVKRIIIDDGWQHCYGEWEANFFFPSGMEALARNLRAMGFTPGLWFAPTILEPHSRIAQLHPEMMAKGRMGLPCLSYTCMERKGFILDPTMPESQHWLEQLFRRYAGYGYDYFKLDFLGSTLSAPCFTDISVPRGRIMRKILEPIRRGVGPDRRILGCNYHFEGGLGLVDDVRISSDINPTWHAVKMNVASIAARFWSNQRFWTNDPDFALVRGEDTTDDPDLNKLKPLLVYVRPEEAAGDPKWFMSSMVALTKTEAEVLLSLVMIAGGAINLSDNLTRLNAEGLALVRKTVSAPKGEAAIALDLFRSDLPAFWLQTVPGEGHRVLLINWEDTKKELALDLEAVNLSCKTARNFWTGESLRISAGKVSGTLPAHGCLLVELTTR